MSGKERERGRLFTYLNPPSKKVAGNKDIHLVPEVVEITFWISRSVDSAFLSISPLREWFTKVRIKHGKKLTQIITSLCMRAGVHDGNHKYGN